MDRVLLARHRVRPRKDHPDRLELGGNVKHESLYLSSIGTGTMVADALSMMNAEFSNTTFRLSRVHRRNATTSEMASPIRREARPVTTACSRPKSGADQREGLENVGCWAPRPSRFRGRSSATGSIH